MDMELPPQQSDKPLPPEVPAQDLQNLSPAQSEQIIKQTDGMQDAVGEVETVDYANPENIEMDSGDTFESGIYQTAQKLSTEPHHKLEMAMIGRNDPNLNKESAKELQTIHQKIQEKDYSQIVLPVIIHDNSIGVLVLEFRPSFELAPEKIRLLTAFANQAGVALENMKLYARAQEKAAFDERQHLARELHDSVSQALYSIVLGSHAAKKQLERNPKKR